MTDNRLLQTVQQIAGNISALSDYPGLISNLKRKQKMYLVRSSRQAPNGLFYRPRSTTIILCNKEGDNHQLCM